MRKLHILILGLFIAGLLCTGCDIKFNNRTKTPPQSYNEWRKKNDPNYKPEKKSLFSIGKPRAKKVPQTYEEWLKKNR